MVRKDLIIAILATFCLTVALFVVAPTKSSTGMSSYDPWADYNGDGLVDATDVLYGTRAYGSSGDPAKPVVISGYDWQIRIGSINIPAKTGGMLNITTAGYKQIALGFISNLTGPINITAGFLLASRYMNLDRFNVEQGALPTAADIMWIEPPTTELDTVQVGYRFNVTVWLMTVTDVFAYQVAMHYNRTLFRGLRAGFTDGSTSQFMASHDTATMNPIIDTSFLGNGSILASESCMSSDFIAAPHMGSLVWIEFEVISVPPAGGDPSSRFDIATETARNPARNWVKDKLLNTMSITAYNELPDWLRDLLQDYVPQYDLVKTYAIAGPMLTLWYYNPNDFDAALTIEAYLTT